MGSSATKILSRFTELNEASGQTYTTVIKDGKLFIQGTLIHSKYPKVVYTFYQTPYSEEKAKAAGVYTNMEVKFNGKTASMRSVTSDKPISIQTSGNPETKVKNVKKPAGKNPDRVHWIDGAWREKTANGWVKLALPGLISLGGFVLNQIMNSEDPAGTVSAAGKAVGSALGKAGTKLGNAAAKAGASAAAPAIKNAAWNASAGLIKGAAKAAPYIGAAAPLAAAFGRGTLGTARDILNRKFNTGGQGAGYEDDEDE